MTFGQLLVDVVATLRVHFPKHVQVYLEAASKAGPRNAVSGASESRARSPGFDTRSGHILSFLLALIQEGQLSVTGESMCTKVRWPKWFTFYFHTTSQFRIPKFALRISEFVIRNCEVVWK